MAGDGEDGRMYVLVHCSFNYCVYTVGSHPTEEPISTKAAIAYNQKQQQNNRGVLLSVTEEIS